MPQSSGWRLTGLRNWLAEERRWQAEICRKRAGRRRLGTNSIILHQSKRSSFYHLGTCRNISGRVWRDCVSRILAVMIGSNARDLLRFQCGPGEGARLGFAAPKLPGEKVIFFEKAGDRYFFALGRAGRISGRRDCVDVRQQNTGWHGAPS